MSIDTIFSIVPSGCSRQGNQLTLAARVVVEWRLDPGSEVPPWLADWPNTAATLGLGARLERPDHAPIVIVENSKTRAEMTQGAGITLSLADAIDQRAQFAGRPSVTKTISMRDETSAWSSRVAARVKSATELPPVELEIDEFLQAFNASDGTMGPPGPTNPTSDEFIRVVAASKHPQAARALGIVFDVEMVVRNWRPLINQVLWLRCTTDFSLSQVIAPFTKVVIRQKGQTVAWFPALEADNCLASASAEGLIRMIPAAAGQPEWFLETAEYFSQALQEKAVHPAATDEFGKPLQETGGLALGCRGVEQIHLLKGKATQEAYGGQMVPVLTWDDLFVGFRLDVSANGGAWASLVERRVKYSIASTSSDDEGYIDVAAIHAKTGNKANREKAWLFEEVQRWDGHSLIASADENLGGIDAIVRPRTNPAAKLRWTWSYRAELRPVFKGGWSLSVGEAAGWRTVQHETVALVPKREERLGPPLLAGLSAGSDGRFQRLICSRDGGGVPEERTLYILPSAAGRYVAKRSGALDERPASEHADFLRLANGLYRPLSDSSSKTTGFPDPWADNLEIQLVLFGTQSDRCDEIPTPGTAALRRGQAVVASFQWRTTPDAWPNFDSVALHIKAVEEGPSTFKAEKHSADLEIAPGDRVDITLWARPSSIGTKRKLTGNFSIDFAPSERVAKKLGSMTVQELDRRLRKLCVDQVALEAGHVTRAPLGSPELTQPRLERKPADLIARLSDVVRVDRQTVTDLVVDATWQDWEFLGDRMVQVPKSLSSGPSQALSVETANAYGEDGEQTEQVELAVDVPFPDLRRRDLDLGLRARPRYGTLFRNGGKEAKGQTVPLVLCFAGRPSSPSIGLVLPVVVTKDHKTFEQGARVFRHDSFGEVFRVYLGNRWFETGPGELLGVVCSPEDQDALSDGARRRQKAFFTQWGAEVLLATPKVLSGPFARHFPDREMTFDGVLSDTGRAGNTPRVAVVAGHAVQFDEHSRQYFADVKVAGHGSAFPWLRLAFARLQPESLAGSHLSPVVSSHFAQLGMSRWITVSESHRERGILRIAATRTPAEKAPSRVEAVARVFKAATELTQGALWIHAGKPWIEACAIGLKAAGNGAESSHWLGEAHAPMGSLLITISETLRTPNGTSGDESTIPWREDSIVIQHGGNDD